LSRLNRFALGRGLPLEYLEKQGLFVSPPDGERPDWIGIPYPHMTGRWHTRYRNPGTHEFESQPKYWAKPGSGTHLYNPQLIGPGAPLVFFTEGEIDCLVLTYLDYPSIGIPGTGVGERFRGAWKLLFDGTRIAVALDNDEPGEAAANKLIDAFNPRAKRVFIPKDMDINDWFLDDEEGMKKHIDRMLEAWE